MEDTQLRSNTRYRCIMRYELGLMAALLALQGSMGTMEGNRIVVADPFNDNECPYLIF